MARTFDGVDDQVAFGSEAAIDNLAAYTACALVRITANITDERQILTKMTSGYVGSMYLTAVGDGSSNNRILTLGIMTGTDGYAESVAGALVVNTWRVVVATYAGVGITAPRIYVGDLGSTIAEVSYLAGAHQGSGTKESDASATLRIAARDPLDTFFVGGLAECALWNRVLSDGEIASLGRGFAPAFFPQGRVFYSKVDGRSSPEFNYAGTTHGTVTGTTYLDHPPVIYPFTQRLTKRSSSLTNYSLALNAGSYALTGSALALKFNRLINLAAGSYAITGSPLSLKYARKFPMAGGAYTLSGSPVSLYYNRSLSIGSGTYNLTGSDLALKYARIMALDGGSYTITGQAANTLYHRVLSADPGSYVIDGQTLNLKYARIFPLGSGAYLVTGGDLTMTVADGSAVATPPYLLLLGVGS